MAQRVADVGEQELYDPDRIHSELQELVASLEDGEIDNEEFDAREDELLDLLEEAKRRSTVIVNQ